MKSIYEIFNALPNIKTERFILRDLKSKDFQAIFDIYSDYETIKYQGIGVMKDIKEGKEYVRILQEGYKHKHFIRWCITDEEDNVLGIVALHHIEGWNYKVEIGYILNRKFWRKGIMTEVLKQLVDTLFTEYDVNKIEASIHPQNISSIKLCEKLDFEKEGLKKECAFNRGNNEFEDRLIYGITKRKYLNIS